MIMGIDTGKIAVWAITKNGLELAQRLMAFFPDTVLHVSENIHCEHGFVFNNLAETVMKKFSLFSGHVFIMSSGIVVRVIAPCIKSKTTDPAVVVMDEKGRFAISLLAGHIGGANRLAQTIATGLDAVPVITTATDVNQVPAIDVIAVDNDLFIENPGAIKSINMAFVNHSAIYLHDPYHFLTEIAEQMIAVDITFPGISDDISPVVVVDDRLMNLPDSFLILRPKTLIAGIGCNRNTLNDEISGFIVKTMQEYALSIKSLKCIASIDIKSDEKGLLETALKLQIPIRFFTGEELSAIDIPHPSKIVEKHIGVSGVCEAAAVIASGQGKLIVPKQTTQNVTLAIARINFL